MSAHRSQPATDAKYCPWCEYELGRIGDAPRCPECGEETGPAARAKAAIRRAIGSGRGRMVLIVSPLVGIAGSVPGYMRFGLAGVASALLLALIGGGMAAIWSACSPRLRPGIARLLLLGTVVGIGFFIVVMAVVLAAVIPVLLLTGRNQPRDEDAPLMMGVAVVMSIFGGLGVMWVVHWGIGRLTGPGGKGRKRG